MLSRKNRQDVLKDLVFPEIAILQTAGTKLLCVLTGRLHFINIWRLHILMDLFENVDRQCKRTTLVKKSSQNVPKN